MLSLNDFNKVSAQDYGSNSLDAINTENCVYLVPKRPIDDLPRLRIRIFLPTVPTPSGAFISQMWNWNWRTSVAQDIPSGQELPNICVGMVEGKDSTSSGTTHQNLNDAADEAIASVNEFMRDVLPQRRRHQEEAGRQEREQQEEIQKQIDDFLTI